MKNSIFAKGGKGHYFRKLLYKSFLLLLVSSFLLSCGVGSVMADSNTFAVSLAGEEIAFQKQEPVIVNSITFIPVKEFFKKLGAVALINGNDVMVFYGKDILEFGVNTNAAKKNNTTSIALSTAPILLNNQILMASSSLTQLFGASISWNDASRLMTIDFPVPTKAVSAYDQNTQKAAALPTVSNNVMANNKMYTVSPGTTYTTKQEVAISDSALPFTKALRIHTFGEPPETYSTQLSMRTENTVKKDDCILISFYARAISSDAGKNQAYMGVVFEDSVSYAKSLSASISMEIGGGWSKYYMPFQPIADYAIGAGGVNIRLGYAKQTIEIADFKVVNYQSAVGFSDLPILNQQYVGQDENAQWRKDAWQRIEEIRKSDFVVNVLDKSGRPVPDVSVDVTMKRNEFDFGTETEADTILYQTTNDRILMNKYLPKLFNAAVLGNDLKWTSYDPNKQKAMDAVNKLIAYGLKPRGHTMIWDRFARYPTAFQTYYNNGQFALMHQLATEHVTEMGTTFSGKLDNWDVVNEIMQNRIIQDQLGDGVVVDWFRAAQAADPHATMFINENTIGFGAGQTKTKDYFAKLETLLQMGADIDALGVQGHYGSPTSPASFLEEMDEYAELLSQYNAQPIIKMTEFDFNSADERLQGDFTRDIMIACYSHPAFTGFIMWGFWDGNHWLSNAPLFTKNWLLKQSGAEYVNLVYNQFWTDETITTDTSGKANVRGFHGSYNVSATYGGAAYQTTATIRAGGQNQVEIRLPFDIAAVPPSVTANDVDNTIEGLDLATMEVAISADGGATYSNYTSAALPALGGSRMVKVRVKATGTVGAGADMILTFTPNHGDVNGDGIIDISDVIMAAEVAVGVSTYTAEQVERANVSHKTELTVDISDVVLIAERAVGATSPFPAE